MKRYYEFFRTSNHHALTRASIVVDVSSRPFVFSYEDAMDSRVRLIIVALSRRLERLAGPLGLNGGEKGESSLRSTSRIPSARAQRGGDICIVPEHCSVSIHAKERYRAEKVCLESLLWDFFSNCLPLGSVRPPVKMTGLFYRQMIHRSQIEGQ